MEKPLVSIIVPIYNAELHLEKCINSIIDQTYTNIECILINDGSTDNSLSICTQLADQSHQFSVYSQENSGVSKARNKGLEVAKGDWFMFVDSDDWIEPDTIEKSLKIAYKYNADIVGFNLFIDVKDKIIKSYALKPNIIVRDKSTTKYFIIDTLVPNYDFKTNLVDISIPNIRSSCAKLFSSSICNKIRFKERLEIGEDMVFSMSTYNAANNIVFINEYLYHYTKNTYSAMHQFKPNIHKTNEIIYESVKNIAFDNFLELEYNIFNLGLTYEFLYNELFFHIDHPKNKASFRQKCNYLKNSIDNKKYFSCSQFFERNTINILPLHQRLFLYLLKKKKATSILLLNKVLNIVRYILR